MGAAADPGPPPPPFEEPAGATALRTQAPRTRARRPRDAWGRRCQPVGHRGPATSSGRSSSGAGRSTEGPARAGPCPSSRTTGCPAAAGSGWPPPCRPGSSWSSSSWRSTWAAARRCSAVTRGGPTPKARSSRSATPASRTDHWPDGRPSSTRRAPTAAENNEAAPHAVDGDSETAWPPRATTTSSVPAGPQDRRRARHRSRGHAGRRRRRAQLVGAPPTSRSS